MLVEIHMLQNHAPSNLNRDDTGSPKDCIFGGIRRVRISSQCLKRSIRRSPVFSDALEGTSLGIRTRRLPELVKEQLIKLGISADIADIAAVKASGFGTKDGKERADDLNTAQTMFLADSDINSIAQVLYEAAQNAKGASDFKKVAVKDLQASAQLKGWRPITPDIALFGRMTTSDAFHDVEAAVQVAHAISTNKMDQEFDYFTAVDDLQGLSADDDAAGADMIGDIEFSSACFYKYFSIDVDALVSNLAGPDATRQAEAKAVAVTTIKAFLQAAVFTTPSGKQNSFAAHQLPDVILVEIRPTKVPVSYANAFLKPARPNAELDIVDDSSNKLIAEANQLAHKYSLPTVKRLWFSTRTKVPAQVDACETLGEMISSIEKVLAQ